MLADSFEVVTTASGQHGLRARVQPATTLPRPAEPAAAQPCSTVAGTGLRQSSAPSDCKGAIGGAAAAAAAESKPPAPAHAVATTVAARPSLQLDGLQQPHSKRQRKTLWEQLAEPKPAASSDAVGTTLAARPSIQQDRLQQPQVKSPRKPLWEELGVAPGPGPHPRAGLKPPAVSAAAAAAPAGRGAAAGGRAGADASAGTLPGHQPAAAGLKARLTPPLPLQQPKLRQLPTATVEMLDLAVVEAFWQWQQEEGEIGSSGAVDADQVLSEQDAVMPWASLLKALLDQQEHLPGLVDQQTLLEQLHVLEDRGLLTTVHLEQSIGSAAPVTAAAATAAAAASAAAAGGGAADSIGSTAVKLKVHEMRARLVRHTQLKGSVADAAARVLVEEIRSNAPALPLAAAARLLRQLPDLRRYMLVRADAA